MLIPMVKSLIRQAGTTGHKDRHVLGMAHRGRPNHAGKRVG